MSTICVTCLSSERDLIQLQNLLEYTKLWHGVSLQMTDYICWECKAMFNNIWRFKQQVLTAQDVLRNQNLTEIPKVNQCLSKLTKSIKTSYDSEYYEDDVIKTEPPSVDYLNETNLKTEVHFTDDNSHTELMKTEIEDTELNHINNAEVDLEIYSDSQENITNETVQVNDSGTQIQSENNSELICFNYQLSDEEQLFIIKVMSEDELLKARESDRELSEYKDSPYKCEKCIIPFVCEVHYIDHFKSKHSTLLGEMVCEICESRFSNDSLLRTHTLRHYLCYECQDCDVSSHRIHVMLAHRTNEHGLGKTYHCKICNAEFIKKSAKAQHVNKVHRERPTCTICTKQYSNKDSLKRHMLIHSGKPLITCEICDKQVKNIKAHMATHRAGDDNAYCAECDIQFKSIAIYKQHLYTNSKHVDPDRLSYACDECGKRFLKKYYLTYHLNVVHYDKKEFVCRICNKGFARKHHLKQHMLYSHKGVSKPRKYICSYCDKRFTTRPVLVNHIRTHTGERPFECDLCDAKFAQQVVLRTHMKGVHKKLFKKSDV